jgi:4-hydroxy-2-oxoglutarate aldolase
MVPRMSGVVLSGVFAPVVSTFDAATGELDGGAFRRNVRAHLGAGLAGVVAAGSSGEAALLDDDERRTLVAWARDAAGGAPVIAGVGAESTRATVRRAREAADAGADLVLVVAPHYYGRRMTDEALYAHFAAVADASPRPVLLYNIPVYAHLVLSPALVARRGRAPERGGDEGQRGDLRHAGAVRGGARSGVRAAHGARRHASTPALGIGAGGASRLRRLFAPAPPWPARRARGGAGLAAGGAAAAQRVLRRCARPWRALGRRASSAPWTCAGVTAARRRRRPLLRTSAAGGRRAERGGRRAGSRPARDARGPALAGTGPAGD